MKKSQRVPLYIQIKEYVLDHIQHNTWKSNDRIPSENELAEQFKVSRITVKNALSELIEEGLIYRIQGKGSFVSSDPMGEPIIYRSESRSQDTKLIACIMRRLNNSQSVRLLNSIETELGKHGYRMILCRSEDSQEKEKELLREMLSLGVKGVLICPVEGEAYNQDILRLTMSGFPIVLIDRYFRGIQTNCVCANNVEGTHEAIKHLIELGHTKIGFVSSDPQGTSSIEDRLVGYEKALSVHNLPIEHQLRLFRNAQNRDETSKEVSSFLLENKDMTAIFASTSGIGINIMKHAEQLGIEVPKDLSVIFFDNYEQSDFSRVVPSFVNQQEDIIGTEAVQLLLNVIEEKNRPPQQIFVPTKLVKRNSTTKCPSIKKQPV